MYSLPTSGASPVCRPMRTRMAPPSGHLCVAKPRWASAAAPHASSALWKTQKNESPSVLSSAPFRLWKALRRMAWWSTWAWTYLSPSSCMSLVEPSMSVKRNVTVPLGRAVTTPTS